MRLNFILYSFLLTLSTFSSYKMDIFLASLDDEEMAKDTVKKKIQYIFLLTGRETESYLRSQILLGGVMSANNKGPWAFCNLYQQIFLPCILFCWLCVTVHISSYFRPQAEGWVSPCCSRRGRTWEAMNTPSNSWSGLVVILYIIFTHVPLGRHTCDQHQD